MSSVGQITLTGRSGKKYVFHIYQWDTSFEAFGAVYAVTEADRNNQHTIVYIGQTGDMSERFDTHHKAACFRRNGANRICVHPDDSEQSRLAKEQDLIASYGPTCNG